MRSGKLRVKITVQQPLESRSTTGESIKTWATWAANVSAELIQLTGREFWAARGITAESTLRFKIRFLEGMRPDKRILYKGQAYNITQINDVDNRGRELMITCVVGLT